MYSTKEFIADSIRIYPFKLDKAKALLDDAYFALEADKQTLLEADRPFINNPLKAQELISSALASLYAIEDEGCNKFDALIGNLDRSIRDIQTLKIEVDVRPSN